MKSSAMSLRDPVMPPVPSAGEGRGSSRRSRPDSVSLERPLEPALANHLLAVGVERIVDDPLRGVELVIVLVAESAETFGHRLEPGGLGLVPQRVVGVGA